MSVRRLNPNSTLLEVFRKVFQLCSVFKDLVTLKLQRAASAICQTQGSYYHRPHRLSSLQQNFFLWGPPGSRRLRNDVSTIPQGRRLLCRCGPRESRATRRFLKDSSAALGFVLRAYNRVAEDYSVLSPADGEPFSTNRHGALVEEQFLFQSSGLKFAHWRAKRHIRHRT